jgi:hypothetical protein
MIRKHTFKEIFMLSLRHLFFRTHDYKTVRQNDVDIFLEQKAQLIFDEIWNTNMLKDREKANKLIEHRPMIGRGEA